MFSQEDDVVFAVAQRGNFERKDSQTEEQIATKLAAFYGSFQVSICGSHNSNVHRHRRAPPDPIHHLLLDYTQKLSLHGKGQFANFSQENCSTRGELEFSKPSVARTGKSAALMTKQFILDQRLRNSSTVDGDERFIAPGGEMMYRTREELFACP